MKGACLSLLLLGALWLATPCMGQERTVPLAFQQGLDVLEAGQVDAAIDRLETVVQKEPAYVEASQGAAAYWLGRAYLAGGDPERAYEAWREGVIAFQTAGLFDVRLADAYIRHTYRTGIEDDYTRAGRLYLELLTTIDQGAFARHPDLLHVHLQPLVYVVPEDVLRATGLDQLGQRTHLPDGAGARLVAWWRSQDVAPATRQNERLIEHLHRVAYATERYRYAGGFDDRGKVYIRLGPPSRTTAVQFNSTAFRNKVIDRSLTLNTFDFPENEFWFYEHIDDAAQFLFHNTKDYYELGEVQDLLPAALRTGVGNTERGRAKGRAVVRTLEEIYRQLSLHHHAFALRYTDVAAFSSLLDDAEAAADANRVFQQQDTEIDPDAETPSEIVDALAAGDNREISVSLPGAVYSPDRPHLFAESVMMHGRAADERAGMEREARVPRMYSNTFDEVEPLPVQVQVARFLDADGTTRTEVYWGIPPGGLAPSKLVVTTLRKEGITPGDYLLVGSVVQKMGDYRERVVQHNRHMVQDVGLDEEAALVPQTYTAVGDTGTYHLALQWDQYAVSIEDAGTVVEVGPSLKAQVVRFDTLQALNADEQTLEMSDLKPLLVPEATDHVEAARPYPFTTIHAETPLGLYFEVYHLTFGPDDQTRFSVEYEVKTLEEGGLLRRNRESRTTAQTEYTGTDRTAREYIVLDLNTASAGGEAEVTVRVTDTLTGQYAERSLRFDVVR